MADVSLEVVMQVLRQMQQDIRDLKENGREVLRRVSHLERLAGYRAGADADREARIDRLAERLERVERRLELRDDQPAQ